MQNFSISYVSFSFYLPSGCYDYDPLNVLQLLSASMTAMTNIQYRTQLPIQRKLYWCVRFSCLNMKLFMNVGNILLSSYKNFFIDCETPAGMEDKSIQNSQITASSYQEKRFPYGARLHNKTYNRSTKSWGAWCADENDPSPYLQVCIGSCMLTLREMVWETLYLSIRNPSIKLVILTYWFPIACLHNVYNVDWSFQCKKSDYNISYISF